MMKIFSRHNEWDTPRAGGDVTASDLAEAELLLSQLTQPTLAVELRGEDASVAVIAARIRIAAATEPAAGRATARPARRAGRTVGVALCVFGATTGAAFAGVLPTSVQQAAHDALERVGISVPAPASAGGTADLLPASSSDPAVDAATSRAAHAPGARPASKGANPAADGGTPQGGPGQGNAYGQGNGKAKGKTSTKNAHGQATAAAHKNGGQGKGQGQGNPSQGGGNPHASGGNPKGTGGGKPADAGTGQGGGKGAGAGGGKPENPGAQGNGKGGGKP